MPFIPKDQIRSDTTPIIYNIALGTVDTEQSQALPSNTKQFIVKTRGDAELKIAYTNGASGTIYANLKGNAVLVDYNFYTSQTIYFQSPTTGDTVEIIAYV